MAGGINIVVDGQTANAVAQRLVCWDRDNGVPSHAVQYRTDGNLPYFHIPAGACAGKGDLTLIPGGAAVACPSTGAPTHLQPTLAELSGINPNTCQELAAPGGLAVTGTPTQTGITVHWTAPAGPAPTGYRLSYRPSSGGSWNAVETSATQATVNGLTAGTEYAFRVQARTETYLSAPSAEVKISTAAQS